jgi:hypothetical protein
MQDWHWWSRTWCLHLLDELGVSEIQNYRPQEDLLEQRPQIWSYSCGSTGGTFVSISCKSSHVRDDGEIGILFLLLIFYSTWYRTSDFPLYYYHSSILIPLAGRWNNAHVTNPLSHLEWVSSIMRSLLVQTYQANISNHSDRNMGINFIYVQHEKECAICGNDCSSESNAMWLHGLLQ